MSDQVELFNGEDAEVIMANSILLRSIGSDANIDAKGGESPAMYFDKFSRIQPVYIVGALPGVLSSSSSSAVVARTFQLDSAQACLPLAWKFGAWMKVPDGATKVSVMVKRTDAGVGTSFAYYGIDGSTDGVTGFLTASAPGNNGFVCGIRDKTINPPTQNYPEWHTHPNPNLGAAGNPVSALNNIFALPPYVRVAVWNPDAIVTFTFDMFVVVS